MTQICAMVFKQALLICLLLCSWLLVQGSPLSVNSKLYAGYKVVECNITTESQLNSLNNLGIDRWDRDSFLALGNNTIRVNQTQINALNAIGVVYEVVISDFAEHFEAHKQEVERSRADPAVQDDFFLTYHTYDECIAFLANLTNAYKSISKFIPSIGVSIEGRSIFAVKIAATPKPTRRIFIHSLQHAREWLTVSTVIHHITELITGYARNVTIKALLDTTEFHFVPLVNPDGYNTTWTTDRYWRKNRRLNKGGSYGVDLNRNWDEHFGGVGSSGSPTSDTYRGVAPFSEPEALAVSDYISQNGPFDAVMEYHCCAAMVLRQWGWTEVPAPNDLKAKKLGDKIAEQMNAVYYKGEITSDPWWHMYKSSGIAQDWCYEKAGIPYSYTMELDGYFDSPPKDIKITNAYSWPGFLYFAQYIADL